MKFILYFFVVVSLLSCNKNEPITPVARQPVLTGSIQYRVNGRTVKIFNAGSTEVPNSTVAGTHYRIGAQSNYSITGSLSEDNGTVSPNNKSISIVLGIDTIRPVNTYSISDNLTEIKVLIVDKLFNFNANDNLPGTSFSITITGYNKGLLSGTFRGTFEQQDGIGNPIRLVEIAEGIFTDVQVAY